MSRADDRAKQQAAFEAEAQAARPGEAPERFDPDPTVWGSRCAGARDGFHRRAAVEPDGRWRCQWCAHRLTPPAAYAHATWTTCPVSIDLRAPIGVQRRRGATPLFVYRCASCGAIHKRPAGSYQGREPQPQTGVIVCGKQIVKAEGAA